jgi:hypothetical protein
MRTSTDQLGADPLMSVLAGKAEPKGTDWRRAQDQGKAGAGKSTLNRLELTPADADAKARHKKIVYDLKKSAALRSISTRKGRFQGNRVLCVPWAASKSRIA